MCRALLIGLALFTATGIAQAGSLDTYRDLVRPNGHPRADAPFNRDLSACYAQTGASRSRADTPAFKSCMLGRQWAWESVRRTQPRQIHDCFEINNCGFK
jgi:hypothetical protein